MSLILWKLSRPAPLPRGAVHRPSRHHPRKDTRTPSTRPESSSSRPSATRRRNVPAPASSPTPSSPRRSPGMPRDVRRSTRSPSRPSATTILPNGSSRLPSPRRLPTPTRTCPTNSRGPAAADREGLLPHPHSPTPQPQNRRNPPHHRRTANNYVSGIIRRHRKSIGSRWRALNPGQQALLVLVYLRKNETYAEVAVGSGVGGTLIEIDRVAAGRPFYSGVA
jgi:hypothetical protein